MRGRELMNRLHGQAVVDHPFIRWWRIENDFLDYDLVERFRSRLAKDEEFGGFDLLTMDEMWTELKRVTGERVCRCHMSRSGEMIEWQHLEADGMHTDMLPYTAETMLTIYDAETRDNPLC